jgi:hypothetical protein
MNPGLKKELPSNKPVSPDASSFALSPPLDPQVSHYPSIPGPTPTASHCPRPARFRLITKERRI